MKRWFLLVPALALLASACGGTGGVVASVDGTDITLNEVDALRADSGSLPRDVFTQDLRSAIFEAVVVRAATDQFGISVDSDAIETRRADLQSQIESQSGGSYQEFLDQQGFTDERIRRIAHQQLVAEAVEQQLVEDAGPVTDEDIEQEYQARVHELTEACISHILVETEDEAQAALDRIQAGEDFGEVAADVSIDPSAAENKGDLGCRALGQYVPEFATAASSAPVGEVTGPVQSQFGFHLIRVDSREDPPSLDEVRDQILSDIDQARGPELFGDWLIDVVTDADVEIDPQYGTWSTTPSPQILPPE